MTWYEIFPQILNMNLTASVIIVFVLSLRLFLKRAPKIYSYMLWSVVLFRLLCPVSISAPVSILGVFDAPVVESTADTGKAEVVSTSMLEYIPSNIVHEEYPEVTLPVPVAGDIISEAVNEKLPQGWQQTTFDPLEAPVTIATYIWMFGILCLLGFGMASYFKLRQSLVGALQIRDNIYLADHIRSPFVMGILRPKIYLPSDLEEQEQRYIILHEKHHIRRGDPAVKMLAFIALCIHWFNPLVWVAFLISAKDMEMSCDEAVVKKLGEEIRADYSASLLQLATGQRILFGTPLAFGEGEPAGRIRNLARFKRPTIVVTIVAAFACVVGILLCVFNPTAPYDSLKMIEQDILVGGNLAKYKMDLGVEVESVGLVAEQWIDGTCISSAPINLSKDVKELQILMKERKSDGTLAGIDIQIDSDETGGSLLTYFAFPAGHSVIGWAFTAYEIDETLKVVPGEEKILAAMAFDEGNGVRVFDCETLVKEPERLVSADQMIVIRATFQEEVVEESRTEEAKAELEEDQPEGTLSEESEQVSPEEESYLAQWELIAEQIKGAVNFLRFPKVYWK